MSEATERELRFLAEQEMGGILAQIKDEGYKEGVLEGRAEASIAAARKMIASGGFTNGQIAELCGLDIKEVEELAKRAD